ncbi:hypothetical protein cypCar_00046004 [Cyprinus carpio]|nr:hypothetical protein cypCar_00046004 [Cyprinus carpio]
MNERKCTSEAFSLLNEYADALYGREQIQMSMKTHQQRFTAVDSGANNVVFIRTHGVDPEQLVHHILSDLHQTKKRKSRVILRMLPTVCCVSVLKDYMLFRKYNLQEVAKEPTNQSTGLQEAANQSTGPQEAANQSTGPQETANQSTGPQEATNQSTGPQEAANQTQEHGDGEKADGSAESHDVSAGNGTKEAELE